MQRKRGHRNLPGRVWCVLSGKEEVISMDTVVMSHLISSIQHFPEHVIFKGRAIFSEAVAAPQLTCRVVVDLTSSIHPGAILDVISTCVEQLMNIERDPSASIELDLHFSGLWSKDRFGTAHSGATRGFVTWVTIGE